METNQLQPRIWASVWQSLRDRLQPDLWASLWRNLKKIDKGKINKLPIALRNAVAVAVPLGIGIAIGNPLGGTAMATGALNVSYSDGSDPYAQRARRMLAWSFIGAIAVFTGSVTRSNHQLATLITMVWAFGAGMQLAISPKAGDLGLNTLVALIVFSARGPTDMRGTIGGTLLVLGGGLLQTTLALLLWPVNRHEPERRAVSSVYSELAEGIATPATGLLAAPLKQPSAEVQDTLRALGRDFSLHGERFCYLFDQTDRIRLSAFHLQQSVRLREHQKLHASDSGEFALTNHVQKLFSLASQLLLAVSDSLRSGKERPGVKQWSDALHAEMEAIHQLAEESDTGAQEISKAADVFAGQLRSVARMCGSATVDNLGIDLIERHESPWRSELKSWTGALRANLSLQSAICRHALRLAIWVGIADAISRAVSWQRSYWIPMTLVVILKPDFTTTLSRGLLRLAGTLGGLLLATGLYHALPNSALTQLLLVGIFAFVLRLYGPANYGVFSVAISGLIVFLIAATGVAPSEVVLLRGTNTIAGGLLALVAYLLWPTWERRRIAEVLAALIDALRFYFQRFMQNLLQGASESNTEEARQAWRRARSDAEGSVERISSEPNITAGRIGLLTSMLASSHALAESIMEMEAGTFQISVGHSEALSNFARDVEFTLYYLSAALRGSAAAVEVLPKLREDHRRLMQTRTALGPAQEPIVLGTDRITTTLNTLREQVQRYIGLNPVLHTKAAP